MFFYAQEVKISLLFVNMNKMVDYILLSHYIDQKRLYMKLNIQVFFNSL